MGGARGARPPYFWPGCAQFEPTLHARTPMTPPCTPHLFSNPRFAPVAGTLFSFFATILYSFVDIPQIYLTDQSHMGI